ncbi:MAG: hypothetical protein FJ296_08400 [Planctomycetes bacterium]|nr:hypothetical protein [Planctomycetota bacterium]
MIRVPSPVVPSLRRLLPAVLLLAAAAPAQEFEPNALAVVDLATPALRLLDSGGGLIDEVDAEFALGSVYGAAFGPDGHLYVASFTAGVVYVLDRDGGFVDIIGAGVLTSPTDVLTGPDHNIWVSSRLTGEVLVYAWNNSIVRRLDSAALGGAAPNALAVAPHRFHLKLKGPLGIEDEGASLHAESDATLVFEPGRGTSWLSLADDPEDDADLASLFGTGLLHFAGGEHALAGGKQRHWLGSFDGGSDFGGQLPTLGLRWKAREDAAGVTVLRSAKGTLHIGEDSTSCVATVRTAGLHK